MAGLRSAWRHEQSLRTQGIVATLLLAALVALGVSPVWWALAGALTAVVIAAELFNTALEQLADRLHPEQHPDIQRAKDVGAAAVLVLSVAAVWVGLWLLVAWLQAPAN